MQIPTFRAGDRVVVPGPFRGALDDADHTAPAAARHGVFDVVMPVDEDGDLFLRPAFERSLGGRYVDAASVRFAPKRGDEVRVTGEPLWADGRDALGVQAGEPDAVYVVRIFLPDGDVSLETTSGHPVGYVRASSLTRVEDLPVEPTDEEIAAEEEVVLLSDEEILEGEVGEIEFGALADLLDALRVSEITIRRAAPASACSCR